MWQQLKASAEESIEDSEQAQHTLRLARLARFLSVLVSKAASRSSRSLCTSTDAQRQIDVSWTGSSALHMCSWYRCAVASESMIVSAPQPAEVEQT